MEEEYANEKAGFIALKSRELGLYEVPDTPKYPDGTSKRFIGIVPISEIEANLPGLELGTQVKITLAEDEAKSRNGN